jgi:hypothetical protein
MSCSSISIALLLLFNDRVSSNLYMHSFISMWPSRKVSTCSENISSLGSMTSLNVVTCSILENASILCRRSTTESLAALDISRSCISSIVVLLRAEVCSSAASLSMWCSIVSPCLAALAVAQTFSSFYSSVKASSFAYKLPVVASNTCLLVARVVVRVEN